MTKGNYRINEHFWTIQGEGHHMGKTAVFLRLQGCPIGCSWCDSKTTWFGGGEEVSAAQLCDIVRGYPDSELIVITGGEPLIYDLDALILALRFEFPHLTICIETSGALPFKGNQRPDWNTVSPKYPRDFAVDPGVLVEASELKYVVDDHFDPEIVDRHIAEWCSVIDLPGVMTGWFSLAPEVWLMPEGCPPKRENVDRALTILRERPCWRFSARLQYDYGSIGEGEGQNNTERSKDQVKRAARERRRGGYSFEKTTGTFTPPSDFLYLSQDGQTHAADD